jgi:glycosyltransferase involved in cell wall biosynthesis
MISNPSPSATRPYVSFVLPCFNEAGVLPETHRRVKAVGEALGRSYEIVMVNDGSNDATFMLMLQLAQKDPAMVVIDLSRNHGHQLALSAGLHHCAGERILIMDADLQDPPELLPEMLKLMDQGADVVYAQRRSRSGDGRLKRMACAVFYRMLNRLSETPMPLDTGDFRLVSRRVLDLVLRMPERQRFIRGMVSWVGFQQVPFFYDRDKRFAGESKYSTGHLLRLAFDGIAASSTRPLALASYAGWICAVASLVLILYALFSWLYVGRTPQGWASLMIVITLMGSVQLFVLGIIGQYLGRIHEQLRGRPLFVVREVVRGSREAVGEERRPDQPYV